MPDSFPPPEAATVISAAILQSSAVTRLALACPSEPLRERAAADLAQEIVERFVADASQLKLSL
jgi:hypothetical protein